MEQRKREEVAVAVVSEEVAEEEETVEEQNRRRRGERHSRRRRRRWFSWETKERERREISSRGEVASLKAPFSSPDKRDKTDTQTPCLGCRRQSSNL